MFWSLFLILVLFVSVVLYGLWRKGYTIQEIVSNPPPEVDLPEVVTILSYLHHELIKHRLPLVRTVADQNLHEIEPGDVELLREAVTGTTGRSSLLSELDGYLSGLQRASGRIHLNFRRDPLARRVRGACKEIQQIADNLGLRSTLTRKEHKRLQSAERTLDAWFRPRLNALRNSVLRLELSRELFENPMTRVCRELGLPSTDVCVELPTFEEPIHVKMLQADFNLVIRNLIRNAIQRSIQATGEPRIHIEATTRIEMTGEESVLLRIYDTDSTILSREKLYGGQIGRGLNLVTTTLRRYNGSLRCARSKKEGFAKFLEVRLFLADPDEEGERLLRQHGPLSFAVPAVLSASTVCLAGVATAGIMGYIPDPAAPLFAAPETPPLPDPLEIARTNARDAASNKIGMGIKRALQDARHSNHISEVPSTESIQVNAARCAQPTRYPQKSRVDLVCYLVGKSKNRVVPTLFAPVLVIDVEEPYNVSHLEVTAQDLVTEDGTIRPLSPEKSCARVETLAPHQKIPARYAAHLPQKTTLLSEKSRILLDYRRCLETSRFPIGATIKVHKNGLEEDLQEPPLTIDVSIQLRNLEEAREAYAPIHNDGRNILPSGAVRSRFTRAIARYVAGKLDYDRAAGTMPRERQIDLSKALYFGWVRPGIYHGIRERVERSRRREGATPEICALAKQMNEGYQRMGELDERLIRSDLYRSRYYQLHAKLWIQGDILGSIEAMDDFQKKYNKQTDFAQGARFYTAVLLAQESEPEDLEIKERAEYTERIKRVLNWLSFHAKKPPGNGKDYDRIKLMGIRRLVKDVRDEGFSVEDALCGFWSHHQRWVETMSREEQRRLFNHCYTLEPIPLPEFETDKEVEEVEEGEEEPPPMPEPKRIPQTTPGSAKVSAYLKALQGITSSTRWSCAAPSPPPKQLRQDLPPQKEP